MMGSSSTQGSDSRLVENNHRCVSGTGKKHNSRARKVAQRLSPCGSSRGQSSIPSTHISCSQLPRSPTPGNMTLSLAFASTCTP